MDHKKSPMRRTKRQSKVLEENYWDCSVCTYRNNAEAFKCLMCDVRKGTSTRKPRLNSTLAAAQAAQNFPATSLPRPEGTNGTRTKDRSDKKLKIGKKRRHPPRLKNVDRSSAQTREVTVNSVTVVITEYKPKVAKSSEPSATSATSSASSDHGSLSESSDAKSMRNE